MEYWIDLRGLGPEGGTFTVDDPAVWTDPIAEFGLNCKVLKPLRAELTLLPQEDGCLVRGRLEGVVALACNRCAEDAVVPLDARIDSFESYPDEDEEPGVDNPDADTHVMRRLAGAPQLNLAGLLWEEFSLALPVKPLCRADCAGLCPVCGANRNEAPCACVGDEIDPRLAALRGLKLNSDK